MQVRDAIARAQLARVSSGGDDFAGELVPQDERQLQCGKAAASINQVTPAYARGAVSGADAWPS